jgi:hypothetical protein
MTAPAGVAAETGNIGEGSIRIACTFCRMANNANAALPHGIDTPISNAVANAIPA